MVCDEHTCWKVLLVISRPGCVGRSIIVAGDLRSGVRIVGDPPKTRKTDALQPPSFEKLTCSLCSFFRLLDLFLALTCDGR